MNGFFHFSLAGLAFLRSVLNYSSTFLLIFRMDIFQNVSHRNYICYLWNAITLYITRYNAIIYHTNWIQNSRHTCTNTTKWLACTTKYFIMYVVSVLTQCIFTTLFLMHNFPPAALISQARHKISKVSTKLRRMEGSFRNLWSLSHWRGPLTFMEVWRLSPYPLIHHCSPFRLIDQINYPTNSTQQSPSWEASVSSPSQEIIFILWNPKVHYRIHKSLLTFPILCKIDPIHVSPSYLLKAHFNIVFPTTPTSSEWFLYLRSPHQNSPVPHTRYMPRPSHSSWFDHPYIRWGLQIIRLLFT